MYIEKMIRKFRSAGLKITPQRVAIFEYLYDNTSHPTVDDIYAYIIRRYPSVSLTTVYNTLQTMVELGELAEMAITYERRNFDPNVRPHAHIMCVRCNRIEDVPMELPEVRKLPPDIRKRYDILGERFYFYGVCRDCGSKSE